MKLSPDDYDVVVMARIVIDDAYRISGNEYEVEFDTKRQLRRDIERKMPDDWTLDDAVYSEFVTYREPTRLATTYELKVYL
jgi:hypothetical protein